MHIMVDSTLERGSLGGVKCAAPGTCWFGSGCSAGGGKCNDNDLAPQLYNPNLGDSPAGQSSCYVRTFCYLISNLKMLINSDQRNEKSLTNWCANLCLKVGVSVMSSGCYWVVRDGGSSCATQCSTNIPSIASGNGGAGIPGSIAAYFFMCVDQSQGDHTNAISVSLDRGNTIDPALIVASNNGATTPSTCTCKHLNNWTFLQCTVKWYTNIAKMVY